MDKLKSAIADKILEVSSFDTDNMRGRLDQISRFRDFAYACQSLISKYPAIESELLRMVENNDFDTKTASTRVDTVIRLCETNVNDLSNNQTENDISDLEQITESLSAEEELSLDSIGYTEINDETQSEEDFELKEAIEEENNSLKDSTNDDTGNIKLKSSQTKDTAKKGVHVIIAMIVLLVLIFAIVFVIKNFETVLFGLAIALVIALIIWTLLKKKKDAEGS